MIAFSSPTRENTADLIKNRFISLHMPTRSKEELLHASKLDQYTSIDAQTVDSLFDKFGGIARYVLEVDEQRRRSDLKKLEAKIARCDMKILGASIEPYNVDAHSHMISHMIIHRNVIGKNYYFPEFDFASPYVGTRVVELLQLKAFDDMKAFVKCEVTLSFTSRLGEWLFKQIVHSYFPRRDKEYEVRKLSDGSQAMKPFTKCAEKVFDSKIDDLELPSESVYLKPKLRTFESADALCPPDYNTSHSIKANGLRKILNKFAQHKDWKNSTRINYYFVVPEDVYTSFTHQQNYVTASGSPVADTKPFDHVDQYVLKFDF